MGLQPTSIATPSAPDAPSVRQSDAWRVETLDPLTDSQWDGAVAAHPEATVFHTSAWARVLVATYGHRPVYLRLSHPGGSSMLLPMMEVRSWLTGVRGVCLPFSDQCGPLISGELNASQLADVLSRMAKERGWKHFEVRGGPELRDARENTSPNYFSHALDLRQSEGAVFDSFQGSVRQAIRKAERSGLKVRIDQGWPALECYYRLHIQTRKKHGLPPQPVSFFRNLHREIFERGMGFVVLAQIENKPVAAAVFLQTGEHSVYKFGASDKAQQEYRGSNLVMWEGIRQLRRSGATALDFGRTSVTNKGLRRFKLSWGTKESPVRYQRRVTKSGAWASGADKTTGKHTSIFGRMPLWANRLVGELLYRHLD